MQREVQVVVVLGTGGTIAGRAATPTSLAYDSAQLGVDALVAGMPTRLPVESEQVAQIDSKDMDFATWRRLAMAVARHLARDDVAGVVVTHGTDTLEETAYFLSRVIDAAKPVVLSAAMRPATSFEADGSRNLADAIAVAGAGPSDGATGVLVAFAAEIHAARDVRKAHPSRLDAFTSGEAGSLGRIAEGRIAMTRPWPKVARPCDVTALPEDGTAWPWVEIVTSMAGSDGRVVHALIERGVAGIVVAATGNGTVHRVLERALVDATARGVAVVRSTRCLDGRIVEDEPGRFPSADDLTPVKARIDLVLDLLARGA